MYLTKPIKNFPFLWRGNLFDFYGEGHSCRRQGIYKESPGA